MISNHKLFGFHFKDNDVHLAIAAELLGVDRNQFKKWMCNRKIVTVQEVLIKPLDADEVTKLCKANCWVMVLAIKSTYILLSVNFQKSFNTALANCTRRAVSSLHLRHIRDLQIRV